MATLEAATAATSIHQAFTDAQVVVLRVQGGDYAVPINRVQEIVRVPEITRVPHAQSGVEGVINLRGRVLPVVDLAARLGLGITERERSARVVVVDGGTESIGLLVDGVSEVLRVNGSEVDPPSETTTGDGQTAVLGVAKLGERLVLLLDLDAALGGGSTSNLPPHLETT